MQYPTILSTIILHNNCLLKCSSIVNHTIINQHQIDDKYENNAVFVQMIYVIIVILNSCYCTWYILYILGLWYSFLEIYHIFIAMNLILCKMINLIFIFVHKSDRSLFYSTRYKARHIWCSSLEIRGNNFQFICTSTLVVRINRI